MMTNEETRLECLTLAMELARDRPAAEVVALAARLEHLVGKATEGMRPKKQRSNAGWTPERRAAAAERMRKMRTKPNPPSEVEKFIAEKGVTKVPPGYAAETSAARR